MDNSSKSIGFKVVFEKWKNPLKIFLNKTKAQQLMNDRNIFDNEDDSEGNAFNDLSEYNGPILATDFGILPLNEASLADSTFNFWRVDTNFPLNNDHKYIIDTCLGVETVNFYTPYCFRISIAKLFNVEDIKSRLSEALINYQNSKVKPQINHQSPISDILRKQYQFFAVAIVNSRKVILHGNSPEEVEMQVSDYISRNPGTQFSFSYKG